MKPCEYYFDAVNRPLAGDITVADIRNASCPDPYAPGRIDGLREEARQLCENTDYAIVADIMCGGPFEQPCGCGDGKISSEICTPTLSLPKP